MGNCKTCKYKKEDRNAVELYFCKKQNNSPIYHPDLECSLHKESFWGKLFKSNKCVEITANCVKTSTSDVKSTKTLTVEDVKSKIAGIKKISEEDIVAFLMKQDTKVLTLAKNLIEKLVKY